MATAATRAAARYHAKAYERINLSVKRGDLQKIKIAASDAGLSVNAYIKRAINADLAAQGYYPEDLLK